MGRHASDWEIVTMKPGIVWIKDLNLGNLSVTNDAEAVCRSINDQHPGSRIIYCDSRGEWDELVHEHGVFKTYKPGFAPDPFIVHILLAGVSLCGMIRRPAEWPEGERWVWLTEKEKATCPSCLRVAKQQS